MAKEEPVTFRDGLGLTTPERQARFEAEMKARIVLGSIQLDIDRFLAESFNDPDLAAMPQAFRDGYAKGFIEAAVAIAVALIQKSEKNEADRSTVTPQSGADHGPMQ